MGEDGPHDGRVLPGGDDPFVVVDWTNPNPPTADGRVTLRLRRTAQGDARLVEVNGVAPSPPVGLLNAALPPNTRLFPTVEFGCANLEAIVRAEIAVFRSEPVVPQGAPLAERLA